MRVLKQKFHDLRASEDGATAVEVALCLPIIIMLAFACFQYGLFYNNATNINKRLDDASRQVKLMDDPSKDALVAHYNDFIPQNYDVTLSVDRVDRYDESFAEVTLTYRHSVDIPFARNYPFTSNYKNLVLLSSDS